MKLDDYSRAKKYLNKIEELLGRLLCILQHLFMIENYIVAQDSRDAAGRVAAKRARTPRIHPTNPESCWSPQQSLISLWNRLDRRTPRLPQA